MTNAKHGKLVSSNFMNSKFGEGVILEPIRTANESSAGGGCQCGTGCACIGSPGPGGMCAATKTCGQTGGCGSSNKIKVYR
ncbi:hypothetical protein FOH38_14910 [Lysinibacillus fusiformis]|nr:hypothetical protein FOH38_14910 [Lysinibacillus fusiformis]